MLHARVFVSVRVHACMHYMPISIGTCTVPRAQWARSISCHGPLDIGKSEHRNRQTRAWDLARGLTVSEWKRRGTLRRRAIVNSTQTFPPARSPTEIKCYQTFGLHLVLFVKGFLSPLQKHDNECAFSEYFCHNYGTRIFNSSVIYEEFQRRGIPFAFTCRLSLTVDRTEKVRATPLSLSLFFPLYS